MGQLAGALIEAPIGGPISLSASSGLKLSPDVGGQSSSDPSFDRFLVTYTSGDTGGTFSAIFAQAFRFDGSPSGSAQLIAFESGVRMRQPVVSESMGQLSLPDDYWTLAWVRDTGTDGLGQIHAQYVDLDGVARYSSPFTVESSSLCRHPGVTSRMRTTANAPTDRVSIVVWERASSIFAGAGRSIQARVIAGDTAFRLNQVSNELEDFDPSLEQTSPSIVSDGNSFALSYVEEDWSSPGTNDRDVYMASGSIVQEFSDVAIALGERHLILEDSAVTDGDARLCAVRDGGGTSDTVLCVWSRRAVPTLLNGTVVLAIFDVAGGSGSPNAARGVQYCDSVPNSVGRATDGRTGGWLFDRRHAGSDGVCTSCAASTCLPTSSRFLPARPGQETSSTREEVKGAFAWAGCSADSTT